MKCPLCLQTGPCLTKTGKLARKQHSRRRMTSPTIFLHRSTASAATASNISISRWTGQRKKCSSRPPVREPIRVPCWTTSYGWLPPGMVPNDTEN